MEKLKSKKFKLPDIFFITDKEELKEIPIGLPYVIGKPEEKEYYIKLLEYTVLYQKLKETGLPFDWDLILKENGFEPIHAYWHPTGYFDHKKSEEGYEEITVEKDYELSTNYVDTKEFQTFVNDATALIDIKKLRNLHLLPDFQFDIENAIRTNIVNFINYNPYMYNKKLGGMYGGVEFKSPNRNLIIVDVSGSMTKSISVFALLESKTMAESFYADILVTGSVSILYPYEKLYELDVERVYNEVGRGNEAEYFKKLVSEPKQYKSAIVFGDDDWPGGYSRNRISNKDGKKLCKWEIEELFSFHKDSNERLAGYARWFSPKKITCIKDWAKYFTKEF